MDKTVKNIKDRDLAIVIGNIMRWGVISALTITGIGGLIFLSRHGTEKADYGNFVETDHSIGYIFKEVAEGLVQFSGRAYITLGILLLFATPVIRVVFSLFGFMAEKDKLYTFITLIVLFIIFISISGGLH